MQLEDLGNWFPKYQPTYELEHDYINSYHRFLASCPRKKNFLIKIKTRQPVRPFLTNSVRDLLVDLRNLYRFGFVIPGWLLREEALKLYEMAYFSQGNILELGCYHGLSTSILARAVQDSPYKKTIFTVDLDPACIIDTLRNLRKMNLVRGIITFCEDGTSALQKLAAAGTTFSFIFIDHSHTYQHVWEACQELPKVITSGGFCLFHDFNNPENKNQQNTRTHVYQAVRDGLDPNRFDFYGIYGGAGLYRAR